MKFNSDRTRAKKTVLKYSKYQKKQQKMREHYTGQMEFNPDHANLCTRALYPCGTGKELQGMDGTVMVEVASDQNRVTLKRSQ